MIGSVWYRLGEVLGMKDWRLAYWVRFFNVIIYGIFVWISYRFVKEIYPREVFSLRGADYFLQHLIPMYWRGEYAWEANPMRWKIADGFYVVSSYLLLTAFAVYVWRRDKNADGMARLAGFVSLYLVLASVLFLAAISLPYDFHECYYPSRAYPYFVSGRIISGTILPFVLIYLIGFEYLWRPIRNYIHPVFPLLAVCTFIMCVEVAIRSAVFHSHFNFFALLGR